MSATTELPMWAAVLVASCVVLGAFFTFIGCLGLVRLKTFYHRVHAPTLGTSFGTLMILLGSVTYFSVTQSRPAVHEALIFVFVSVTTPVTLMLLARAAIYRDRAEKNDNVPSPDGDTEKIVK
ncbi:MAG TPA: monovalent cation/H(+) antiporter subunit G [Opitutaceae bacterium]|nr:monovalent cation/H(+) antiporter subunit G [Opitutaceae bacterium]